MPSSTLEERVAAVVQSALRSNFVVSKDKASWVPGFIAESILVELIPNLPRDTEQQAEEQTDTQQTPPPTLLLGDLPENQEQAEQLWGPLLIENLDDVQQEDVSSFTQQLLASLTSIAQEEEERLGLGAEEEEGEDGACEMCHRMMPLTKHHLIPRDVHKLWKQRGATYEELQAGIMVCRPCHNAVHRVADNKLLAQNFNTLDTLLAVPSIQKHIGWASKQKVTVRPANLPGKARHRH